MQRVYISERARLQLRVLALQGHGLEELSTEWLPVSKSTLGGVRGGSQRFVSAPVSEQIDRVFWEIGSLTRDDNSGIRTQKWAIRSGWVEAPRQLAEFIRTSGTSKPSDVLHF